MESTPQTPPPGQSGPIRTSMRVYRAEQRRRRRWPKALALTFVALLALVSIGAGGLKVWAERQAEIIGTAQNQDQAAAQAVLDDKAFEEDLPNRPIVAMVVGVDRRKGDTSSRSDTMLLVRIDPKKKAITTLSFPRDLLIDVPGHGRMMINEAYALGKEKLALETITQLTGIRVNYLVPIDFKGFYELVDAFGGVWVEVDRRYYHKNESGDGISDFAEINLGPGYRHLSGRQALDFARYRHTDSDIVRLARQQMFLREFRKRIDAWSAAKNVFELINVAERNMRILGPKNKRPDADTLLGYANLLRAIPRENIQTITLEVTPDAADPNRSNTNEEWVQEAVSQFLNPDVTIGQRVVDQQLGKDKKAAAATAAAPKPAFKKATFRVETRNGAGEPGVASDAAYLLVQRGWKNVVRTSDADSSDYLNTTVYYADVDGAKEAAEALGKLMGADSEVEPLDDAKRTAFLDASGEEVLGDVVVVVGRTFDGTLPQDGTGEEQVVPEKQKAQMARDAKRDLDKWRLMRRKSGIGKLEFPVALPVGTVSEDVVETSFDPFYAYTADGRKSVHVSYRLERISRERGSEGQFGVQAVKWGSKTPPILDSPSAVRQIGGREYRVYLNGSKIHRIAWQLDGSTWMWVSNSLTDQLTNDEMVAIARGFRPVPR